MHERPLVENGREVDDGAQQRTPPKRVTASVPPYHRYSTYKYNSVEYHPNRICPSSFQKLSEVLIEIHQGMIKVLFDNFQLIVLLRSSFALDSTPGRTVETTIA